VKVPQALRVEIAQWESPMLPSEQRNRAQVASVCHTPS
jgi:hypothetical protein